MKTTLKLFVLILSVSLFSGCEEEMLPADNLVQNEMELKKGGKNGVMESVSGSGHLHRSYGEIEDVWRTFTIHAQKMADGTVKGKYQLNNHGGDSSLKGDVICFTTIDNKAVLIVEWTDYNGDNEPTWPLGYIIVEDNGSGKKSDPDRISLHHPEGWEWVEEDCGVIYDYIPLYQIEGGNIKVHKKK